MINKGSNGGGRGVTKFNIHLKEKINEIELFKNGFFYDMLVNANFFSLWLVPLGLANQRDNQA